MAWSVSALDGERRRSAGACQPPMAQRDTPPASIGPIVAAVVEALINRRCGDERVTLGCQGVDDALTSVSRSALGR